MYESQTSSTASLKIRVTALIIKQAYHKISFSFPCISILFYPDSCPHAMSKERQIALIAQTTLVANLVREGAVTVLSRKPRAHDDPLILPGKRVQTATSDTCVFSIL